MNRRPCPVVSPERMNMLFGLERRKVGVGYPRNTYMYITVNGKKLKINPLQNGGARKFPGNNDTDILITQMGYK